MTYFLIGSLLAWINGFTVAVVLMQQGYIQVKKS